MKKKLVIGTFLYFITINISAQNFQQHKIDAGTHVKPTVAMNEKFATLEKSFGGRIGISAINTANNQLIQYRANEHFPIQSTFKLIGVGAILKKSATDDALLQQKIAYSKKEVVFWSPITEKHVTDGMSVCELCEAAMMYSDNTAINLIVKKLGSPKIVTDFARSIGDTVFRIDNWEPNLNSDPTHLEDTSTPSAMLKSMQQLTLGNVLPSQQRDQLVSWMKRNTTGDTRIRAGVPNGWIVADKTGAGDIYGISNDIAIIWPPKSAPIVLAIYTAQNKKDAKRRDDIVVSATRMVIERFAQTDRNISLK